MRTTITLLGLLLSLNSWSLSYKKVPLNEMIDDASIVCRGKVIKVETIDSSLSRQFQLIPRKQPFVYGAPSCGRCSYMALFFTEKVIKGQLERDTIEIAFSKNRYYQIHGLQDDTEYILFLDKLKDDEDVYALSNSKFGSKSWHIDEYTHLIERYLLIEDEIARRSWITDLCINPRLSYEGTRNYSNRSLGLSRNEKLKLVQGLLRMDFNQDYYRNLLKLVQLFGPNDELAAKCFDRLRLIDEENVSEGIDLALAINTIAPNPDYDNLSERLYPGFLSHEQLNSKQQLAIIHEFLDTQN